MIDNELIEAERRGDCEIISQGRDESDLAREMTERSCKAGHTTKFGECPRATKIQNRGFGESKLNVWPRDESGKLIGDS